VDATSWENCRGFGRFARNAIGRLVELDRETTYVFVTSDAVDESLLPRGTERLRVPQSDSASQGPTAGSSRSLGDLVRLARTASRKEFAAFLFPSHYSYFPVIRVPTVVGVHDTTARKYPELLFASRRERAYWRLKESRAVRGADRLFTVSAASRDAIASAFGISAERIAIVPEAPDPVFSPRSRADVASAVQAIGLGRGQPFVVYAAGISPHKNIESLLEAFSRVGEPARLVLVGDLDDGYLSAATSVRARIAELGLESRVVMPGFLSDDDLARLYSGAAAAVVPSLSEGFGLPAVEAAACGSAVVVSDLPAHRETLGTAALLFEPTDVRALAEALHRLLGDESLRREVAASCRRAVSHLSWDTAASRLRELIAEVAGRRDRG